MGSEFVRRKSSVWAKKSDTKPSLFTSRSFSSPRNKEDTVSKKELPSEVPPPDYIFSKMGFNPPKPAVQTQQEDSESREEEQQEQEQPDVMSKSDAPPAEEEESKEEESNISPKSDAPTSGDEENKEEKVDDIQTAAEIASSQSEEEDERENLNKKSIQTKLTVGKPGDKYEQEADATAAKVMGMSDETVQRQADEEKNLTPNPSPMMERGEEIQTKGKGNKTQVSSSLESRLGNSKGGGSPLPDNIRSFMEPRFGADFSGVNVHTNSNAVQMNKELGAQAFAHGNDIYYGGGKSPGNDELTAHELTHTIQQTGGKLQAKSINKIGKKENKVQAKPVSIIHMKEASPNEAAPTASPVPTAQTPGGGNKQSKAPEDKAGEKAAPTSQTKASNSPVAATDDGGGTAPKVGNGGEQTRANSPAIVKGDSAAKDSGPNQSKASNAKSESKSAASPETDPDFQAVVSKAKGVAEKKKQHDPADKKAKQAQDAAQSPANEVESKAQGNQVGEMEKAPTPAFNGAAFKAKLMERIKEAAPKNLDEADKFKENNQLGAVKNEMQGKVKQEQTASQTPLEEKAKQAPDTSGIESKSVTPLPANPAGTATKNIGARKAVPKAKGQGEVEAPLQESSRKLDQQMADANVTEQQLAKSNEPQFQAALETKKQTQSNANQAPQEYRQFEQNQLNQAQTEASLTAQEQLQGMHGDRAQLLSQVTGQQVGAKGKDEQERAKITGDIQKIYQQSKTKVETVLSSLDTKVQQAFDDGAAQAKQAFEDYVDQRMEAYKDERYSGLDGKGRWIKDLFLDLPSEVNAFYEKGRQLYLNKMDVVLDRIVNVIGTELTKAKAEIANGRKRIQQYVTKLPQNLKAIGQQAATDIQTQFDELEQSVDSKQDELINNLAQKYNENLQTIDSRIDEMKAANQGLVSKASNAIAGVIDTINKLKDMLLSVLNKAAGVIGNILQDPIGFLGNLISGIKQGFENFAGNITNHLQSGLIGWLTGALGPMGIQLPDDIFSLPGIFSLTTQVLGLTFDYIRAKAVKKFGEPVVAGMEQAVEIFQILRDRGAMGLWEHVQEQFNDLKETVIEEIKNMVITQVITAGVKWVLSLLNPASAFVKAAMAIYDIIMFFVNRGSQVLELVNSVVDAVAAIASGAVGGAAKLVENALSRALPVVIGFLASLLGIGGLAKKVEKIIGRIRQRIDKAIDKVLLKAKGLFKGKKGKGKANKSESDKKHASMGKAAAKKLAQKPSKELPYDELRKLKEKEAKELEKKYNKQLEKPVKMTISFQSPEKDKQDGDMDFHIHIGPNDFDMDSAVEGGIGTHEPEVGTYGDLRTKSGDKNQEAHHVPPKGLFKWIVGQANAAIINMSDEELNSGKYGWIAQLAEIKENIYDPGNPLAAISINKHTHIKKTGNPSKDACRVHYGKETAKKILERLDPKVRLIYRTKYNQLTEEDKNQYRKLLAEAEESVSLEDQQQLQDYEDKSGSVLSTQFFSTELNAALKEEQNVRGKELDEFKANLGNVAKGAYLQAHEAVTFALEKSDRDGPKDKRQAALANLKRKSEETWNNQAGISDLRMF